MSDSPINESSGLELIATSTGLPMAPLADTATIVEAFTTVVAKDPGRALAAVRSQDGFTDISAGEFSTRVTALAAGLIASGVQSGDRVALMSGTRVEWLLCDLAILMAGAVTVPIYDTSSAEQIQWIVSDSGSVLLIVENEAMRAAAASVADGMPGCREVLVIDAGAETELAGRGAGVDQATVSARSVNLRADDLATVIYTSGTTGRPKGCVLTHRNLRANAEQSAVAVGPALQPDESGMMFLPLAHVLTKAYALFCLEHQIRLAFATSVTDLAAEFPLARPTVIAAVPRIFEKVYEGARQKAHGDGKGKIFDAAAQVAIDWSTQRTAGKVALGTKIKHTVFDKLVYGKIRAAFGGQLRFAFSGGGPLGERLTHFFAGIGLDVYEGYGLTETSPLLTINAPGAWKPGSVGRAVAGTDIAIAADGEILARGPQIFSGYWNNESATAEVMVQGWFHTGDIGELDDDGFLRITGRKKEIIVTAAGKNVAPAPLEDRLRANALISQAVVVGEGRPFVAALIALDEEALARWCAEQGRPITPAQDLVEDEKLRAEIARAVEAANASVSRAESIREFVILPRDLSIENGDLTPTLKVRRNVVEAAHAAAIEGIYAK
jgi:long-chain acyl-CoA synthetase